MKSIRCLVGERSHTYENLTIESECDVSGTDPLVPGVQEGVLSCYSSERGAISRWGPKQSLEVDAGLRQRDPGRRCSRERSKGESAGEPGWMGSAAREQRSLTGVGGPCRVHCMVVGGLGQDPSLGTGEPKNSVVWGGGKRRFN